MPAARLLAGRVPGRRVARARLPLVPGTRMACRMSAKGAGAMRWVPRGGLRLWRRMAVRPRQGGPATQNKPHARQENRDCRKPHAFILPIGPTALLGGPASIPFELVSESSGQKG